MWRSFAFEKIYFYFSIAFHFLRISNFKSSRNLNITNFEAENCLASYTVFFLVYRYMCIYRGARGVMVIVVGNGHGDTSSNPGRD